MSVKTFLVSRIAEFVTSERRQAQARQKQEARRRAASSPHTVDYFHDATDPYAQLCVQVLASFAARYDIALNIHLVDPPPNWAAPDRLRLEAYARLDAERLAARAGLRFKDPGAQPSAEQVRRALSECAGAIDDGSFLERAAAIGEAAWGGEIQDRASSSPDVSALLATGNARRKALGHYLGATFHYAGEWYWGLDRLHYLEDRLTALGARKPHSPASPIFAPPGVPSGSAKGANAPELHYYLSFRSPYTYIAADRVKALADAYGAELKLRFVLPMVMRGLPVPATKRNYIAMDTAREARRLGIPFGRIADPLGKPVERGYAILPWAREQGRGFEFCQAFLRGVWSKGVDAGSESGMRQIVEAAGLDWRVARSQLDSEAWRVEEAANQAEMLAMGVWGVPSFRVGDTITWGQDRLWLIEDELKARTR
jgi:2-hydroxychromene-2-carboxylate isomerase